MASHLHHAEAHESLPDLATPQHKVTQRETSRTDATPTAKLPPFDAIRFQLSQDSTSAADRRAHGLPTPPYSETTSSASASGSVGRVRVDSSETPSKHLPVVCSPVTDYKASASPRPTSVASSSNNTGSDTVGATSPLPPHQGQFRASRLQSSTNMAGASTSVARPASRLMAESADSPPAMRPSSLSSQISSPGERRKRRSEMHEREVSQIRSESRLGFSAADDDDDADNNEREVIPQQHPFPRTSQHKYSPRKSTALSVASSHYDEEGERAFNTSSPLTPSSARASRFTDGNDTASSSTRRLVRTTGPASGRSSLDDLTSPRISSASRSPMPSEFRMPDKEARRAYRAAHQRTPSDPDDSDRSGSREELISNITTSELGDNAALCSPVSARRESLDEIQEEGAAQKPTNARSPQNRRRRYASDAAAEAATDETPSRLPYDGRLGTQGSRISVDSSSAQRYLARGSLQSTPSSSTRRTPQSSEIGSPSDDARARKISSTSSSRSQKSSSSASELHRAASRVSMRRQHGSDLFSAEPMPQPSSVSARPYSPSVRTERSSSLTNSSDRSRPHFDQPRRVNDAALDHLRNQIHDLPVGRAAAEHDRRHAPPMSLRTQAQLGTTRSSLNLDSPAMGSMRTQSVMGLRTPNDALRSVQMHQYPSTDPQRSRHDRTWPSPDPNASSDAVHRIHELVGLRSGANSRQTAPPRSSTAMGTAAESFATGPGFAQNERLAPNAEEPAPIRNLAVRLAQYEALYTKTPAIDATNATASGPHTARTVELMGAIVRGTSTMWAELASMQPIATEGHLMGRPGDAFTDAFGQLDEGLAFVNKLVLEQARAMQDLLFLLDRTEKERQVQFNQALIEMGHSPRPFSRIGTGSSATLTPDHTKLANGNEASGTAERNTQLLRRATSSVRSGSSLNTESPSPFTRSSRGSAERGGTLTASQLRSMTSLGYTSNHTRSASELSPSSSAAQRRLDRVAAGLPRESSQDSPLTSRRSVVGQVFPASDANQLGASSGDANATGAATSRPPPAFTPRRPRLSNPSVSNATASYQPSTVSDASSLVTSSPENSLHNGHSGAEQFDSEGSTIGREYGSVAGETDEFGRVVEARADSLPGGDTVRLSSRSQRRRSERDHENATIRGGTRVVDTLASQLDTLRVTDGQTIEPGQMLGESRAGTRRSAHRRYTTNFEDVASPSALLADALDESRSPTKLSQYGLTKNNPPPRPPRHIQRPSEESISSPARKTQQARDEPSTPTSTQVADVNTPRQSDRASGHAHDEPHYADAGSAATGLGASSVVRSLGRTAARRVSRVLGSS
ncbi:uncharacterized protein SPSC_03464 [Sporisorium scitamineum]|uniref:Uncharacterized protein n=1 Tax=Sporisorium scitamineum TaxID=49012 RepID=A0A0F7SDA7_9BASI|nr:uncharacterized protein SPSC_03464 [Sporisorium scitamineum]CDW99415.1 hypothetical protein [Sporisorium scitamineum]